MADQETHYSEGICHHCGGRVDAQGMADGGDVEAQEGGGYVSADDERRRNTRAPEDRGNEPGVTGYEQYYKDDDESTQSRAQKRMMRFAKSLGRR